MANWWTVLPDASIAFRSASEIVCGGGVVCIFGGVFIEQLQFRRGISSLKGILSAVERYLFH